MPTFILGSHCSFLPTGSGALFSYKTFTFHNVNKSYYHVSECHLFMKRVYNTTDGWKWLVWWKNRCDAARTQPLHSNDKRQEPCQQQPSYPVYIHKGFNSYVLLEVSLWIPADLRVRNEWNGDNSTYLL